MREEHSDYMPSLVQKLCPEERARNELGSFAPRKGGRDTASVVALSVFLLLETNQQRRLRGI